MEYYGVVAPIECWKKHLSKAANNIDRKLLLRSVNFIQTLTFQYIILLFFPNIIASLETFVNIRLVYQHKYSFTLHMHGRLNDMIFNVSMMISLEKWVKLWFLILSVTVYSWCPTVTWCLACAHISIVYSKNVGVNLFADITAIWSFFYTCTFKIYHRCFSQITARGHRPRRKQPENCCIFQMLHNIT